MNKYFLSAALINIIACIASFVFFVVLGGFDLYLGKGSPVWLCWVPSIFFIGCAFNLLSAYMNIKILKNSSK